MSSGIAPRGFAAPGGAIDEAVLVVGRAAGALTRT